MKAKALLFEISNYKLMVLNNDNTEDNSAENKKPNAYRVEDDNNPDEKDLERNFLFGDAEIKDPNAPGMEGKGMGGQKFGESNLTPSGDDKNNPSQNAGYDNAYFKRTEPSEETQGDNDFKPKDQEGEPDYDKAEEGGD